MQEISKLASSRKSVRNYEYCSQFQVFLLSDAMSWRSNFKRIRRATTNIDDLADVISDDSIMMPEINILRLDQSQEVARLLDNINEGYADILTLKYLYEYTDKEIAEVLFMSEGSVRTKLTRARQACKDVLGGERYEYE